MRVIDIENIVTNMKDDARFVLRCEEVFHDKISSAAASILMNKGQKPIVCLTGPSGSGKTTTAMRLREYLENLGVKVCMLSMDNFFLPLDQRPPEASDWESPYCVNRDLLIEDIHRLMDGELVELPVYDFKAGGVGGYKPMQGDKDAVIIAEGIHMLNPLIFDQLRSEATGVYVAPRTRIITHKDRIVRPEQLRVSRRIFRHLIPNVIPQLIVNCTMSLGSTIITEATLSFLGLGVKFPFASWGNIMNDVSNSYVLTSYWFIWIPAGICLMLTVLGFNFVGDGLRDAFDPKMKR